MADTIVKLTYDAFMRRCKAKGINVDKITRNYVYVKKKAKGKAAPKRRPKKVLSKGPKVVLKNITKESSTFTGKPLGKIKINANWADGGMSLSDCIKDGKKITAIKIIRANSGCGLKDAKDICDANWASWFRQVGTPKG